MLKDFRAFVLRGNVVDLAVGVVIGAAFSNIVNKIVVGMINPIISFTDAGSLENLQLCLATNKAGECKRAFAYGDVLSAILTFILTAAVIFFFVVKPVNHLMARFKSEEPTDVTTRDCPECLSKIPLKARRCAYCTAEVSPAAGAVT